MNLVIAIFSLLIVAVTSAYAGVVTSMNDIMTWVGSGTNKSVLVVDFHDGTSRQSFAVGYKWSGNATGADLLTAVNSGLTQMVLSTPSYVTNVTYLDTQTGVTHSQVAGNFTNYPTDWISWGYYLAGGLVTTYDQNFNPIGTQSVSGGGASLPSNWTVSSAGASDRFLSDGSWDAFSFGAVDSNFDHTAPPASTVFAAVPEPSISWLVTFATVAIPVIHASRRFFAR